MLEVLQWINRIPKSRRPFSFIYKTEEFPVELRTARVRQYSAFRQNEKSGLVTSYHLDEEKNLKFIFNIVFFHCLPSDLATDFQAPPGSPCPIFMAQIYHQSEFQFRAFTLAFPVVSVQNLICSKLFQTLELWTCVVVVKSYALQRKKEFSQVIYILYDEKKKMQLL